jgi:5-methylcytosine-specific restriction enzyme A
VPEDRYPNKYFLLHNSFLYPPKYLISIANQYANKTELASSDFTGGLESNTFLEGLGFELVEKPAVRESQKWLVVTSETNWNKCLENHVWGG